MKENLPSGFDGRFFISSSFPSRHIIKALGFFILHPSSFPMRLLRVFLCHASQDKPAVWRLHRYLTQHGVKPWLDQEDLLPGEDWEVEIPNAIYASDIILVCLSKNSVNKEGMVQKEISFALDKALEKPGKIFIIPVKLEECDVPNRLSRYQWLDYFRPDGRKRLLMSLNKRVTELGGEVSPVILEDSKQRTPRPQSPKSEILLDGDGSKSIIEEKTKKEKGERERNKAENRLQEVVEEKAVKESKVGEKRATQKERVFQNRMLEAAIEKEVVVDISTELFVFVRRLETENIITQDFRLE